MTPEQFNSFTEVEFLAIMGAMLILGAMFGWLLTLASARDRKWEKREAAKQKERREFVQYLTEARNEFVEKVWSVEEDIRGGVPNYSTILVLRVSAENILLAFDQLRQFYKDHE